MAEVGARPSLIVLAFACSPRLGSEPGAGWGIVNALMEFADVTVITGSRYLSDIQDWQQDHPDSTAVFVEVSEGFMWPLVSWHRIPSFLYYLYWLRKARKRALALVDAAHFDGAVHATYAAFWLPTPMVRLGLPSVWGPVGGAVTTPRPLRRLLGLAGTIQESLDFALVRLAASIPASRRTALAATERILQNEETRAMLPSQARARSRILNHSLFSVVPDFPSEPDGRYALWVSPLESRKGPLLALEAIARTRDDITLQMVGDGPQRKNLERAAADLGIAHRVEFKGRVPRDEVVRLMRGATTVLFTGLREEGGVALAEAMYAARRIVVLDHGGAGAIARTAVDASRVALVPPADVPTVSARFASAIEQHMDAGPVVDLPLIDRQRAIEDLAGAVKAACEV